MIRLLLTGLMLSPFTAFAKPAARAYDLPKVVAIQNRPYYLKHDLGLHVGALPSDVFNKGLILGLNYTYFFSDFLGWEVIHANYNINSETALKDDIRNLGVDIESQGFDGVLDYITYYFTTNIVYTPFYNKSLMFNDTVVHGETSFVLGGGAANFNEMGFKPMLTAGLYVRFFSSPSTSWRFDFRNNIYFEEVQGAVNAWSFILGYHFQLGDPPAQLSPSGRGSLKE